VAGLLVIAVVGVLAAIVALVVVCVTALCALNGRAQSFEGKVVILKVVCISIKIISPTGRRRSRRRAAGS
jgi:hypothetical protein